MVGFMKIVGAGGFLNSSKAGPHLHLSTTQTMNHIPKLLGGTARDWYMGRDTLYVALIATDKIYFNASLRVKLMRCPPFQKRIPSVKSEVGPLNPCFPFTSLICWRMVM